MRSNHSFFAKFILLLAVVAIASPVFSQGTWTTPSVAPAPRPAPFPAAQFNSGEQNNASEHKLSNDQPLSGTRYDCGHPTNEEQLMLELINWARANPAAEGMLLDTTTDPTVTFDYSYFHGIPGYFAPTPQEVDSAFATYPARPPLAMNANLLNAARGHDQAMITNDSQYHYGPDGGPGDRITNSGYTTWNTWGENCYAYGSDDIFANHAVFQIDFGNSDLGHRHNIMNFDPSDAVFTEVGLGVVHGGTGLPNVGTVLTTEDYVRSPKLFILGVVYSDSNQNNFYDIGEGDTNVTITVSTGTSSYAITSGSGGYAIPMNTGFTGTVTVTAKGGPFTSAVDTTVEFNGENVKVDFVQRFNGFPTQVSLISPSNDTELNQQSAQFTWDSLAIAGITYHIQIATNPQMTKPIVNDSGKAAKPFIAASYSFAPLQDTTMYYWRVQAKNSKGIAPWSDIDSFYVSLSPDVLVLTTPANGSGVPDSDVNFAWQPADRVGLNGINYWLSVATDQAMQHVIFIDSSNNNPNDAVLASNFQVGQTYYWTVRAQNDVPGWSAAPTPWSFTFGTQSSVSEPMTNMDAPGISPNPARQLARITFDATQAGNGSVELYNSEGARVASFDLGMVSEGPNTYDLDISNLRAGTYECEIRTGNAVETARLVIVK